MVSKLRVAVVTSHVPFVQGGHLLIAQYTTQALREHGYESDLILTPQNRFGRQGRAYLANWFTDVEEDGLGRKINQVISFRFPSFAVRHPFHVCWLNHRLREYYDLWKYYSSQLRFKGLLKEHIRRTVFHWIDSYLLKHNVSKLFAQSKTIQKRLTTWGKIPSELLYPPPPQRNYRTDSYENFIFSVSRLHKLKRLDLLIDSFKYTKNKKLQAFIIGKGPEKKGLQQRIKENNLQKRIYLLEPTDENNLIDYYARCRAVFFSPLKEDYGLVTGEAFASRKPVLTTTDSGGPAELVKSGFTGYVVEPQPEKIAEKLDTLAEDKNLAEQMGENAFCFISQFSWEKTIQKLVIVE